MATPHRTAPRRQAVPATERPAWLAPGEYPFTSRYVEIEGSRVHYVDEGAGPTLLFVHAGPAWSFIFRDVIVRLRDRFRCVALDFPGSGLSRAAGGYAPTLPASHRLLERFIDALDLSAITLVAHDLGGPVGLGVAARRPGRFRGLVLTDTFGWPLDAHPHVARLLRIVSSGPFGFLNAYLNVLARVTATSAGIGRHLSAAGQAAFLGPYRDRAVRRNAVALLGDALRSRAYLREVERALGTALGALPVLLIYGERDPGRAEGFQARFERILPDAQSAVIAGAHHFPHMDAPDQVAGTIVAWWEQQHVGQAA